MRRVFFIIMCCSLLFVITACNNSGVTDESTTDNTISSTDAAVDRTESVAGTDMSADEIVSIYNDSIRNASQVTRLYSHAEYNNFTLSAESLKSMAESMIDNVIKNDDVEYTTSQRSEIGQILPAPCLDKSMIKEYSVSDDEVSLQLYDVKNPTDESCIKLYSKSYISGMFEKNGISTDNIDMSYTDCRIDFCVKDKTITDLSYSWSVCANGGFELLFKKHSFGIEIDVGEAYKIII